MTIKTKLTLNVIIVIVIVVAVAATSITGMGSIKSKLFYLTEQSTPYQVRTLELQRALQGTIADLVKTSASKSLQEYNAYRIEVEKSLAEVKNTQDALESLSGGLKIETYDELSQITKEIFEVTEGRLKAEQDAIEANKTVSQRLKDASVKLDNMDTKIKSVQFNRSAAFNASQEDTNTTMLKLRRLEQARVLLKDMQLSLLEIQKATDKRQLIVARGKVNSLINGLLQNEFIKESKKYHSDIKTIAEKTEEITKLQTSILSESNENTRKQYDTLLGDITERIAVCIVSLNEEILTAGDKFENEIKKQGNMQAEANTANNVLISSSTLVSLGSNVEGLTTRLFTSISNTKEIDIIESDLKKMFDKIDITIKKIEDGLRKLDAREELKIIDGVKKILSSIEGLLLAKDGIIIKIRHQMDMKERSIQAAERLREIVIKQANKSKETVSTAKSEQEMAIATVNKTVRFSTMFIAVIGISSIIFGIIFGTWIYRSISKPLTNLIKISDDVSQGNLKIDINVNSNDEIGIVQTSMSKMISNLKEIVEKIGTATGSLASSSEELSATATSLEKGSQEQHNQIDQSTASITEMAQTTLDVAKNTSHTAEAAQKMKQIATQGKNMVHETSRELQRFADTVTETAKKVESLGNRSTEINNIITLIKEIADQTNLLALNAAIEAARAGEQGKGFAVVADNVRQLAERTTVATEDIANTIKAMQAEVSESVSLMKEERESVKRVLEHVSSTLKSIDEIVSYVENVTNMVQRIAVATDEQSSTSEDVAHNMEKIAMITRDLRNSFIQIKRASEDLSKLASELNSTTGWFKV